MNKKEYINEIEGAEYGVDSRYTSRKEKLSDGKALMEARLHRMKNLSSEQIIRARLLQLKLKMDNFLKEPVHKEEGCFTKFLGTYIDTIYSKRKKFAEDIDITPILLSKILNKHREPQEEFMLRLMIHSEKTYKSICDFNHKTWYEVFFQERLSEMMARQDKWRPKEEKHVHIRNLNELIK
jgi:hypothetical protein